MILPVRVTLKRFAAPRCVFIFGIGILSLSSYPAIRVRSWWRALVRIRQFLQLRARVQRRRALLRERLL